MALSVIREGRKPTAKWLPSDRLLSLALTLHEKSIGPCGHHMDEAYDGKGVWLPVTTECAACAALEKYQAEHEKPGHGEKVFVMPGTTSAPADGEVRPQFS